MASDVRGASHHQLKLLNVENLEIYREWINDMFKEKELYCPEMMMARFTILFKNKNSKLNLDNYRATKVALVTGRVVQRIILKRWIASRMEWQAMSEAPPITN